MNPPWTRAKPLRAFSKHLICKRLPDERRQKLVKNDPLIVPPQLPGRFVEHAIVRYSGEPRFIDERVVSLEHGEMQLRHQHVRIVARVADNRDALCVSLQVCSVHTKQELRRVVTLVEERMAGRSVAVEGFKIELRAASIVQFRGIGMGSQNGPVSRYVVSHKLAEDGPTGGGVSQGVGSVIDVSAIAETACATERVQELLIGLKRWKFGKHPSHTLSGPSGASIATLARAGDRQ